MLVGVGPPELEEVLDGNALAPLGIVKADIEHRDRRAGVDERLRGHCARAARAYDNVVGELHA